MVKVTIDTDQVLSDEVMLKPTDKLVHLYHGTNIPMSEIHSFYREHYKTVGEAMEYWKGLALCIIRED